MSAASPSNTGAGTLKSGLSKQRPGRQRHRRQRRQSQIPPDPTIRVHRHPPNFRLLAEEVYARVETLTTQFAPCRFFNPEVTITADSVSPAFMHLVRKSQARWARRVGPTFPRKVRRSQRTWVSSEPLPNKALRVLDRAASFIGLLYEGERHLMPHEWPTVTPTTRRQE